MLEDFTLNDWIAKEPEIRSGQRKGCVGRAAQIEDYLHQRFLEQRAQAIKVKRAWFTFFSVGR